MKIPLYKQINSRSCGPAALRMVLAYYKTKIPEKEIIKHTGGLKKYGLRTIHLADFAEKIGFKIECLSINKKLAKGKAKIRKPAIKDIIKHLKKQTPVIIAVSSNLLFNRKSTTPGHFIVITRYNKGFFWYNDPKDGKQHKIKDKNLLSCWYNNNALDSSAYLLAIKHLI